MEEFQEADVLWPWPDTPPPWPEDGGEGRRHFVPGTELLYEDVGAAVGFSCEPFSEPAAASSSSSSLTLTLSAPWSSDGFFLSGPSTVSAGLELELDAAEEFLEADVLWPDTDGSSEEDDGAAEFCWWRCRRREEEAAAIVAAAAAAAAACGMREGRRPPASSPIDIPMATTRRRRLSPSAAFVPRRR